MHSHVGARSMRSVATIVHLMIFFIHISCISRINLVLDHLFTQEPGMVETLSKNITRQGLTATTLNYLRVSTTNVPGRLEDLPPEEANEVNASSGGPLPSVSTVVGGGTPGPLPSSGGAQLDGLDFGSDSFQFQ